MDRRLAWAGIVFPPFFVLVFLILGFVKPNYSPIRQFVSEGSIGQLGWVQIANFLVFGAALVVFAIGLWRGLGDRVSGRVGSALIAIAGVGVFMAGPFVTDPGTTVVTSHGAVHIVVSLVGFGGLAGAAIAFARRFAADRGFVIFSIVVAVVIPVSFAGQGFVSVAGLIQRVMVVIALAWLTLLGVRLRSTTLAPIPR
jgi:Protein of unknown function (DUF998)